MIAVAISWTVAFFFANLFQCLPVSTNWTGLGATAGACINTNQMYLAQAWSDVFTDGEAMDIAFDSGVKQADNYTSNHTVSTNPIGKDFVYLCPTR